jgi:hypothetical protein
MEFILGALWRKWDGHGKEWHPSILEHGGVRIAIGTLIALWSIGVTFDSPVFILWPVLIAMISIAMGPSKFIEKGWSSWLMGLRYTIPAVIAVSPSWFGIGPTPYHWGLAYVGICLVAGLVYPITYKWFFGKVSEYAPELAVGAAVIGGLSVI